MTAASPLDWDRFERELERIPVAPDLAPQPHGPRVDHDQGIYSVAWDAPEEVRLEFDLLTTDRRSGETHAELTVFLTDPASAALFGRQLHRARVNLLSTTGRTTLAKYLAQRDPASHDWPTLLEEAMQQVLTLYRAGEPAILLRDAPDAVGAGAPLVAPLLAGDGATILFGDGGTGKSYLALALAASLHTGRELVDGLPPSSTRRVGYLDWEWSAAVHRRRLAALWPDDELPDLVYVACRQPLREERDRLRRIIRDHGLEYLVIDSIALAAGGEPESAEVATGFFGALRSLGLDALCVAHVTNAAAKGGAERPFGSAYWHNSARATWYVKGQEDPPPGSLTLGLYQRKVNDGPRGAPFGLELTFTAETTRIRRSDVRDVPDLAAELPVAARMARALAGGSMTLHELAEEVNASIEAVRMAAKRGDGRRFVSHAGPDGIYRWGLLHHE